MMKQTVLGAALLAGTLTLVLPATALGSADPSGTRGNPPSPLHALDVSTGPGINLPSVDIDLTGKHGQRYVLRAGLPGDALSIVAAGQLDDAGRASLQLDYPVDPGAIPLAFQATFISRRGTVTTAPFVHTPPEAVASSNCNLFDFEHTVVPTPADGILVPTVAGQVVSPGNTWTESHGLTIRVMNFGGGPDLGVIFDSFAPTGGDTDLSSPAQGGQGGPDGEPIPVDFIDPIPYGKILIVQENEAGCDTGICDIPDDEAGGGKVFMIWENLTQMCWLDLLDIDEGQGALVETFGPDFGDGGIVLLDSIVVPPGPDNCFKRVFFSGQCVTSVEITFPGSGAVAEFGYETCLFDD